MRNGLIYVLIVAGVAFATSFLLTGLAVSMGGAGTPGPSPLIGTVLGISVASIYLLLSGNRKVPLASAGERERALAPPADGSARLLVFREGFVGKLAGVDLLVDGAVATQLKCPRFAALTLTPGRHVIEAEVQRKRTEPLPIDLVPDGMVAVRIVMGMGKVRLERETDVASARAALANVPMVAA